MLFLRPNPILQWLTQWGKKKKNPCHTFSYPSDLISCHPPPSSLYSRHKGLLAVLPTLEAYFHPRAFALTAFSTWSALPPNIYMAQFSKLLLKYHLFSKVFPSLKFAALPHHPSIPYLHTLFNMSP